VDDYNWFWQARNINNLLNNNQIKIYTSSIEWVNFPMGYVHKYSN